MNHVPIINDGKLCSEYEPDDNLLPVIVDVFSLHNISAVLEEHVDNPLPIIYQSQQWKQL